MKITAALLALAAASFSGCVVYTDAPSHPPVNAAPTILWADAGCYFDTVLRDEVWYFEADADDPNGVLDVTAVYADVYDSRNGQWIETFELFPTADPYVWYSDRLGSTTRLDCSMTATRSTSSPMTASTMMTSSPSIPTPTPDRTEPLDRAGEMCLISLHEQAPPAHHRGHQPGGRDPDSDRGPAVV